MKVRAKSLGYYDNKRFRPGQEFVLVPMKGFKKHQDGKLEPIVMSVEQQFSSKWMEPVDGVKGLKSQPEIEEVSPYMSDDEVEKISKPKKVKKNFFKSEPQNPSDDDVI